jgi:glycosyltransferase involved in cell wall biosynthesis
VATSEGGTAAYSNGLVAEVVTSRSWDGPTPRIAVLVATYRRPHFLAGLFRSLEDQDLSGADYEVVVVDNGSNDTTWAEIEAYAATTPLRLTGLRVDENHGPAKGRNAGAALLRAPLLAITDDDCLPDPGWLRELAAAFDERDELEVLQGEVRAEPSGVDAMGPWDHTKWIQEPTPFFETCNVAYRRAAFERVGGFDEDDELLHPKSGRAFGEDACLAWSVVDSGGEAAFVERAVVHHRCIPAGYRRWLRDMAHVDGFPGLARRSPLVARWLHRGVFLSETSAAFDLAVAGVVVAAVTRRPWPLLATWPWLRRRGYEAVHAAPGDTLRAAVLLGGYAVGDGVALARLLQGSIRYRRVVL